MQSLIVSLWNHSVSAVMFSGPEEQGGGRGGGGAGS